MASRPKNRNHDLRQQVLAARDRLSAGYRQTAAAKICELLESMSWFHDSQRVAAFWPVGTEVDIRPAIERAWEFSKAVYLPRMLGWGRPLQFFRFEPGDRLVVNRWGISEPAADRESIDAHHLDLVITPLAAFSPDLGRMGMGAGFYDRTFAFRLRQPELAPQVGVAFRIQEVPDFSRGPWDVPLSALITESGVQMAGGRSET